MIQSLLKGTTWPGQSTRRSSLTSLKLSLPRYAPPAKCSSLCSPYIILFLSFSKSVWVSHDLFSVLLLLISLTQSCRILQKWRDLNSIIPLEDIINKESSRRWGDSSNWTGHLPLKTNLSPETKWRKSEVCSQRSPAASPPPHCKDPGTLITLCCLEYTWTSILDALQSLPTCCHYSIQCFHLQHQEVRALKQWPDAWRRGTSG